MSFNSLVFLIYLPIVLLLYYGLPHKFRWIMLLVASYFFYAYFDFKLVFLILLTTGVSYLGGLLIERTNNQLHKKLYCIVAVGVSLAVLAIFKYFNFALDSIVSLINAFGGNVEGVFVKLILPVGISFYTFQTLSYVIDVYRGTIKAERHFGYYALFVSFFPQLVAGPIERPENLLPQLKAENKFDMDNIKQGFTLAAVGFVNKVAIADTIAVFVNSVYNSTSPESISALSVIVATLLFSVQVYCDFSGYSDIATGCAKMMGIDLMVNFNKPFKAQSVTEFFNRWHISLSSWFNDYVYLPLAYKSIGKKNMRLRHCLKIMLVFFLSGLWHGAAWTYVIWGCLNGFYQVVESLLRKPIDNWYYNHKNVNRNATWRVALRTVTTFLVTAFTLIFFRANSVGNAFTFIGNLFANWSLHEGYWQQVLTETTLTAEYAVVVVLAIALLFFIDNMGSFSRGKNVLGEGTKVLWNTSFIYMVWLIVATWVLLIASGQSSVFIYFQF